MIRTLPVNVVAGATVSKSARHSIMLNLRSTIFNIESTVAFESASFQTHRRHHISRRATQAVPKRKGNFRLHAVSCSIASGRVASTKSSKTSKNIQFRTTADLIVCLKHFAAISQASLSSSCEVQVQMTLAANKAVMDAHHNNGFAKGFLGLDGMKEVLKLCYHSDKHVHKCAFGLARALCQQRWVTRELVHQQLIAQIVPLIAAPCASKQQEACKLMVHILSEGQEGGFVRHAAAQIVDNGGLQHISTALNAHPSEMLGRASGLLGGVAAAGSTCYQQLMFSEALTALAASTSTVLVKGVHCSKPPVTPADVPDLHRASNTLISIAKAAVHDGPSSTAMFISHGALSTLLQMQTPWLLAAKRQWQADALVTMRVISEQHPAEARKAFAATHIPFTKGTTPQAWLSWWDGIATELHLT